MRDEMGLLELFTLYRKELGYGFVAAVVCMARAWQKGDPFRTVITNGAIVAMVAFGMKEILNLCDINEAKWGYLASVFLGYVGVEAFLSRLPIPKGPNK